MAQRDLLNDRKVKAAKPDAKKYRLADGAGLSLVVLPSGSKAWRLKYRFTGKQKELALGLYPDTSLADARVLRDEARTKLSKGIDPAAEKQAQKRANQGVDTFESVAWEWLANQKTKWADSNYTRIVSRLERDAFPAIGSRHITEITPTDIIAVIKAIESRGAVESAYRVQGYIRQIFTHAIITERCTSNPAQDLQTVLTTPVKTNRTAITDPTALGHALRAFDEYSGTLPVKAALRLIPLIFLRSGELRHLRWENVNLETAEIRINLSKRKKTDDAFELIVPLARQAIEILTELKPYTEPHEWVFTGPRPSKPISENATLTAMRNCGITKEEATNHGFRATARTLLDEALKFPVAHIEMQLGHVVRDPLGTSYNRTSFLEDRKLMMQRWADHLDELKVMAGSNNIISIKSM